MSEKERINNTNFQVSKSQRNINNPNNDIKNYIKDPFPSPSSNPKTPGGPNLKKNHQKHRSFHKKLPKLNFNATQTQTLYNFIKEKIKENGSIFYINSKKTKTERRMEKKLTTLKDIQDPSDIGEINKYNVFNNEDNQIKGLMNKFYVKSIKQKPPLERRKIAMNKLYDITPELTERVNQAKHKKFLSLENYQSNILNAFNTRESISRGKLFDLVQDFNDLRTEAESIKPLPKINVDIIEEHVRNKQKYNNSLKKMSVKDFIAKKSEPIDEYEKEERLINSIKNFKLIPKKKRNKNLDNMPVYIRELFAKGIN